MERNVVYTWKPELQSMRVQNLVQKTTIIYEVYQGISAYRVKIVYAQIPECPRPTEGPELSILRQCIFEALFEQVRISVAFCYKPQTGFQQSATYPLSRIPAFSVILEFFPHHNIWKKKCTIGRLCLAVRETCWTVPLAIPVSVTREWKKMVNKLRRRWSPQLSRSILWSSPPIWRRGRGLKNHRAPRKARGKAYTEYITEKEGLQL